LYFEATKRAAIPKSWKLLVLIRLVENIRT